MNDYAVIKNALVASFLVIVFMVSLQPEKVSSVVLNITNFATDAIYSKDIDAAETNPISDNEMTFSISSKGFVLPKNIYTIESDSDASRVIKDGELLATLVVGDIQDNLRDYVMSLSNEHDVQPVLRGNNFYYEVTDNGKITMSVKDIGDNKYLGILIEDTADESNVERLLSDLRTL